MNPAVAFIVGAVGLMLAVVLVLGWSVWRGARAGLAAESEARSAGQIAAQANVQVYREQLTKLEREHDSDELSDADWQQARDELTRRMLEDVKPQADAAKANADAGRDSVGAAGSGSAAHTAPVLVRRRPLLLTVGLALLVPTLAVVMYARLGQPMALDPRVVAQGTEDTSDVTPQKLADMATALTRRLQDEPNSVEGWVMLGRVQRALGLLDEADAALSKALSLTQDDDLKIERAEVLAQKNGGNFAGEPWAIIQRVLAADPHHLNALLLAGSASYAEQNYRAALGYWERARPLVGADSPDAAELDRALGQTRDKLGLPAAAPRNAANVLANNATSTGAASQEAKAEISKTRISGRVSLSRDLAAKVSPTDVVLIYAVPLAGSRMPVAMVRTTVDKLPFDFVLDDSTAMAQGVKLSDQAEVTVRVRISKQAQAAAQAGDLGVSASPVKPGTQGLDLKVRDTLR